MGAFRYRKTTALFMITTAGLIAAAPASEGLACGYEDPQSVSRGSLNWSYADSLHVVGAISQEVAAKRLPPANSDREGVDLFGRKFQIAKSALEHFGAMLIASSGRLRTPVAVVLIEPMLWARFEPTAAGLRTAIHAAGAGHGDLVMITGEAVITEIAAGRLTLGQAYGRGVVRLYGDDAQIAAFIQDHREVGAHLSLQSRPSGRQIRRNHKILGRESCAC